jgi:hypothetical protein
MIGTPDRSRSAATAIRMGSSSLRPPAQPKSPITTAVGAAIGICRAARSRNGNPGAAAAACTSEWLL